MGTLTITPAAEVPPEPAARHIRWNRWIGAAVVIAVVAGGLFAADSWARGGTRLVGGGAGIGIGPQKVGVAVNIGVELQTTGGPSVVLQSVRSTHSANLSVTYAIVHTAPGAVGIGSSLGSIQYLSPIAVHGARIAQPVNDVEQTCTTSGVSTPSVCTPPNSAFPDRGQTELIVTVRALRPGRWSVTHIRIAYESWRRTRTVTAGYDIRGTGSAH